MNRPLDDRTRSSVGRIPNSDEELQQASRGCNARKGDNHPGKHDCLTADCIHGEVPGEGRRY